MKTLQVAFLVIVLTDLALCRSASKTKFSLQELALFKQITEIGDKFSLYWLKNSQCINEIIVKSDVKDSWNDIKSKIDELVNVEWETSTAIKDIAERQKSKVNVVEKGVDVIKRLVSQLNSKSKLDLSNQIASSCWEKYDFVDELEHFESFTVPNKFQCLVNAVGNVSENNRLKHLWSKVEPDLQRHLDKRMSCSTADWDFNHLCNLKEGIITYKLLTNYLHSAAVEKPQMINRLACEVEQGCSGYQFLFFVKAHEVENADRIIEILKCHSEAINETVRLTYIEMTWKRYQQHLKAAYKHIKSCERETDKWEATKCIAKEAQRASELIGKFMGKFEEKDEPFPYDYTHMFKAGNMKLTYESIKDLIKNKCHIEKKGFFGSIVDYILLRN